MCEKKKGRRHKEMIGRNILASFELHVRGVKTPGRVLGFAAKLGEWDGIWDVAGWGIGMEMQPDKVWGSKKLT